MEFELWIALIGVLFFAFVVWEKACLHICAPNEVLIFSGRSHLLADGTKVGYRTIRGGRGFKWPIVETAHRMSLASIPVSMTLNKALTRDMIPVELKAVANVKVSSKEAPLHNAIERFLGKRQDEIARSAREIVEGNLRGVLASLTPEEANAKRAEVADQVKQAAAEDLGRMGLDIDTLKIEGLSDGQGYLEALGRKKSATVLRDAKVAEAEAEADALEVAARARERGRKAALQADQAVVREENAVKDLQAELDSKTNRLRATADVAGEIARVEQMQQLEELRIEVHKKRCQADVVVPALARQQASEAEAVGEAARIMENGKATAGSMELLRQQWEDGGTKDLFLLQMLPDIIENVTSVVRDNLKIDKVTVVDSGSGQGIPSHLTGITGSVVSMMEQLRGATGLDIPKALAPRSEAPRRDSASLKKELKE